MDKLSDVNITHAQTKSLKMRIRTRINPTQSRTARFTPSPASSQSSKGSGSGKSRKGDRKGIEVGSKEEGDTPWTKQQMDAIKWGFKPGGILRFTDQYLHSIPGFRSAFQ
eukprot:402084-Amorphochlora_amoeboformis.AAC.1